MKIILLFFFLIVENWESKYFTPEKVYQFAEYLYKEGDYVRAATEFQRYLLFFDFLPSYTDSIYYKIGMCYRLAGNFQKAIYYFSKIIKEYPKSFYFYKAYYQIALSYFLWGKYDESLQFINSYLFFINQDEIKLKTNHLIALNYIYQKKWIKAYNFLNIINMNDSLTLLLTQFAKEGKNLPRKNKFLAGLFSTVVPGTGKIYCERVWDGFFSLITIGITGYQAYKGFRQNGSHSLKGWILGTISVVLYLGNIYGSIVSAEIYNLKKEEEVLNKVRIFINVNHP